jgi:hypothetical protein
MGVEQAIHIVIPDTQAKAGVPTDHLRWIGEYILRFAGNKNIKIIHLGDHADMPSLSSYDKGKKSMEGRRYKEDIKAANEAFDVLCAPLEAYNAKRKAEKRSQWWPERYITLGNHEDRISRACEDDAQLDGMLSLDDLNYADHGWNVIPFLKPLFLDGVGYVHYWQNVMTGKPLGGNALVRLKNLGHTFVMGHQQELQYANRFVAGKQQHGLVAGACYLHDESYKGYQGNAHWRGIVILHEVRDGSFDPMFVSLDFLCRRSEGVSLEEFLARP